MVRLTPMIRLSTVKWITNIMSLMSNLKPVPMRIGNSRRLHGIVVS